MTIYAFAYLFIALATSIAVLEENTSVAELIASALVGLTWPLFITTRVIRKIIR